MFFGPILPKPCCWSPQSIVDLRWKFRVSQREFGEMLGVDTNTVKSWESARRKPTVMACRLFDIFWTDSALIPVLHRYYKLKEARTKCEGVLSTPIAANEIMGGVPSTPIEGKDKVGGVLCTPGNFFTN